jgi:multidrug efflux pump
MGNSSRAAQDWALSREAKLVKAPEIIWDDPDDEVPVPVMAQAGALKAAE